MYAGTGESGNYFGAEESKTWLLGIGSKFGVTNNGSIYATQAHIEGEIIATSGKIGTMTIEDV
jgi:hypothetical protein